jgi:signal transduction histidine kinase
MKISYFDHLPISRVSIKLCFVLIVGGFLIFGAYGWYELNTERRALRHGVEQETSLLGRSLQVGVENALRDRQLADIEETIKQLARIDPDINIVIYDPQGQLIAAVRDNGPPDTFTLRVRDSALTARESVFTFYPAQKSTYAVLALPLTDDNRTVLGGLVVVRPLEDMRRALRELQQGIVLTVCLFVLTTTVLGLLAGWIYINRPLSRMAAAMKQVRDGNLQSTLPVDRRDEMGAIAAEFNTMVAELREARQRLEQEGESRRHLQHALQEADKLITIGQLSAGLAHEIGSPLQVLRGRARTLLARADDAAEVQRNAEILITQTDRITRIVEQLLRFTRRRSAALSRNDVGPALRNVVELMQHEAQRRGVSLSLQIPKHLPPLWVDTDEIQQIVLNLIANALVATSRGGYVTVRVEESHLAPRNSGHESKAVRLVVADTGRGIAPDVQARLFEPFFTTRAAEGGTGLGLAVVKALVTDHGGTITVESTPGVGSEFVVTLPVYSIALQQEAS